MVDKLKSLVQMSEFIAANSTQTYESWTHFLQFSGRFYKYTYDEQISIYFQRKWHSPSLPVRYCRYRNKAEFQNAECLEDEPGA